MNGVSTVGLIDGLAAFAAEASGAAHRERLALHAADGVLALLAGALTPEGNALRDFFACTERSMLASVSAHAAVMRLTEIDDIHRPTAVTASAIALPVALGFSAGQGDADASRFFDSLFVGQEIAIRMARAMGGAKLLDQGIWPSYVVAPVGAAATAGRMLGLDAGRMRHALALALSQTPRAVGKSSGERPGRWLLFGNAVRSGCLAALAARDGIDGDPSLLSDAWLRAVGGAAANPAALTISADDALVIDELSIKPHCSAKQALAAIHGMRGLIADGVDPSSVEAIELYVPSAYAGMLQREPHHVSRLASMVNASWQLALAAGRPERLDDVSRTEVGDDASLRAFAAQVRVLADVDLDQVYPRQWPARLVVMAGGKRHEVLVLDSPGDPALRYGAVQLLDKAQRILGASPDVALVARVLEMHADAGVLPQLVSRFQ